MTMEFEQFQQEAIQLKARLNESQVLNENLRKEKVMWLAERQQLIDARDDLNEILKCEREMASKANTTDEINKLVEKIEKEKSRMKTSYKYFSGVSKAHRQKEDEWNTEKTRMAIELITERTYHEMELKNEQDRYKSIIQQKDDEHKAHIERVRREFERKLKKKWLNQFLLFACKLIIRFNCYLCIIIIIIIITCFELKLMYNLLCLFN